MNSRSAFYPVLVHKDDDSTVDSLYLENNQDDHHVKKYYSDSDNTTTTENLTGGSGRERVSTFDRLVDQRDWNALLLASSSNNLSSSGSSSSTSHNKERRDEENDFSGRKHLKKPPPAPPLSSTDGDDDDDEDEQNDVEDTPEAVTKVRSKKTKKTKKKKTTSAKSSSSDASKKKKTKKKRTTTSTASTSTKSKPKRKTKGKTKPSLLSPKISIVKDKDENIDDNEISEEYDEDHQRMLRTILSLSLEDEFSLAPAQNMRTKADVTHENILNEREPEHYKPQPNNNKNNKSYDETEAAAVAAAIAASLRQENRELEALFSMQDPRPSTASQQQQQPKTSNRSPTKVRQLEAAKQKGLFKNLWKRNGNRGQTKKKKTMTKSNPKTTVAMAKPSRAQGLVSVWVAFFFKVEKQWDVGKRNRPIRLYKHFSCMYTNN